MSDAPERIWAQDAQPDECDYTGGGWWDDACGNTQYSHMVEYIRTDIHQSEIERLTAALETAREVKVKPLVWDEPSSSNNWVYNAPSPFGTYYIHICGGRHQSWLESHEKPYEQVCHDEYVGSVEAAQSLAQADHEARIRAWIEKGGDA